MWGWGRQAQGINITAQKRDHPNWRNCQHATRIICPVILWLWFMVRPEVWIHHLPLRSNSNQRIEPCFFLPSDYHVSSLAIIVTERSCVFFLQVMRDACWTACLKENISFIDGRIKLWMEQDAALTLMTYAWMEDARYKNVFALTFSFICLLSCTPKSGSVIRVEEPGKCCARLWNSLRKSEKMYQNFIW